jgi:hypothetical protein
VVDVLFQPRVQRFDGSLKKLCCKQRLMCGKFGERLFEPNDGIF